MSPESGPIAGLMSRAQREGEPDVFHGKRDWVRYNIGMKLEAKAEGENGSETWTVVTHNISGGGMGIWSKRRVEEGSKLWVRETGTERAGEWIETNVAHCSLSISGHLVGVSFHEPLNPESSKNAADIAAPMAPIEVKRTGPKLSVVTQTALILTLSVMLGTGLALLALALSPRTPILRPISPVMGLFASALTAWLGYGRLARAQSRFAQELCKDLERVPGGKVPAGEPPTAPTFEMEVLRKAYLEVRRRWHEREADERSRREKLEELNLIKSNILNMVSHDLRTPLTSILMYTEMLREDLKTLEEEDQQRFLRIISEECSRLSRLVDDLLEAQRLESGRVRWTMKPIDLSELVRKCTSVFAVMAGSKDIALTLDCAELMPPMEADADRMAQVVSNLLSNALKYTPSGGSVHVSAGVQGTQAVICVSDNGPGIPRDQWDQIFDRFAQCSTLPQTRDIPGVGLGLYIVRQIVEQHNGRVWVDSEVGRGSAFYVSLPTEALKGEEKEQESTAGSRGRVLVCDSDPEMMSRILQALRQANYTVRHAHSGCRLLALAEGAEFDVIFTDILLPDMDATNLLDSLARVRKESWGLVVHSYAGEPIELRRWGADVFLQRPATTDEILQAVRVAQHRHGTMGKRTVLIAAKEKQAEDWKRQVTELGHLPMTSESLDQTGDMIRDYPIDVALISSEVLSSDWSELGALPLRGCRSPAIVVCERVERRHRKLAEQHGVVAVGSEAGLSEPIGAAFSREWSLEREERLA